MRVTVNLAGKSRREERAPDLCPHSDEMEDTRRAERTARETQQPSDYFLPSIICVATFAGTGS